MCEYLELQRAKVDLLNTLDILLSEAERNYDIEHTAATSIQRVFRGTRVRDRIAIWRAACCQIERVFRGHMGRNAFRDAVQQKKDNLQYQLFEYFALQLQKMFRAYYSRKYRKNHANRKKYLSEVSEKGEQVRRMLQEYAEQQKIQEEQDRQEQNKRSFQETSQSLHHLVGTAQIRGVFNPPSQYLKPPTVNGTPIEEHLRGAVKDLLRSRGITKKGLVVDMNGSRRVPYKGLKSRLSIQASAPYGILDEQKTRDRVLHNILTLNPAQPFMAGGTAHLLKSESAPLAVGDPFMDAWTNPMLVRGVPTNQKQLLESSYSRKSLFSKAPDKPFYLATGGNKNSVLPSGLFDVIADAEQSGGTVNKHKGISRRFGLPDSADNRGEEGDMAPTVGTRTTSLRMNIKLKNTVHVTAKDRRYANKMKASYEDMNDSSDEEEERERVANM